MKMNFLAIFLILLMTTITGCKKSSENNDISLLTKDIFNTPAFSVKDGEDMGIILLGTPDVIKEVTLTNNSAFPFTEMEFIIDDKITANIQYTTNTETGETVYPGGGGTCQTQLPPKSSCKIYLTYKPTVEGEFKQKITWNYKNQIDPQSESKILTVITGRPASLIYTNDKTKYSFGVIERTDNITAREEILNIKNTGGLPAKDIIYDFESSSGSTKAFTITSKTCTKELKQGEECQITINYSPQNYDYPIASSAPDGNTGYIDYKKKLTLDYIKDPFGKRAKLNSYFSFTSTTIEGRLIATGLSSINFTALTVGTEETKKFSFVNEGFKESILKRITVARGSSAYAYCYKITGKNNLECESATTGLKLKINEFPFIVKDNESCLIDKANISYTRLPDSSLSETLKVVTGKDPDDPLITGELCSFDLTFHPSVKYIQGKAEDVGKTYWKDTLIFIEYDSTWKNNIVLYNDTAPYNAPLPSDEIKKAFEITKAEYKYAGRMDLLFNSLNGVELFDVFSAQAAAYKEMFPLDSNIASPSDPSNIFLSDIGEIALISGSIPNYKDYAQKLIWRFQNIGDRPITNIQSIFDDTNASQGFKNTNTGIINDYFEVEANTCSLLESGTNCNIVADFTPISGLITAGVSKKEYMFDKKVNPINDEGYRRIVMTYEDGATWEDEQNPDGSFIPRKKQRYEVRLKGKMVSKGLLSFGKHHTTGDLTLQNYITGNTYYHDVEVKNIGTGNVHKMTVAQLTPSADYITHIDPNEHPFKFIPHPTAPNDCLDVLDGNSNPLPGNPTLGNSTVSTITADGGTCLFRVQMTLPRNGNFLKRNGEYDNYARSRRPFTRSFSDKERVQWKAYPTSAQLYSSLMLKYNPNQDALQSASSTANVLSTSSGRYTLATKFSTPSDVIISLPSPGISARSLKPEHTVDESDAGGDAAQVIGRYYSKRDGGIFDLKNSTSHIDYLRVNGTTQLPTFSTTSTIFDENTNDYDHLIHFGTFKAGSINAVQFNLTKTGDNSINNGSVAFDPATTGTEFTFTSGSGSFSASKDIKLDFQAASKGLYYKDILVEFENGWNTISSPGLRDGASKLVVRKKIRIVAEVIDAPEFQSIEVSIADVPVTPGVAGVSVGVPDYSSLIFAPYDHVLKPTIIFEDVKGGLEGFTEKQIKIKNNSGTLSLGSLYLTIGSSSSAASFQGVTKSAMSCYDIGDAPLAPGTVDLNPNEYCTMNVRFAAQNGQSNIYDARFNIVHLVSAEPASQEKQNRQIVLPLRFNAYDPATLNFTNLQMQDIAGVSDVGIVELGYYVNSHITLDDTTQTSKTMLANIENTVTNKASLLAQYEDHQKAIGNTAPFTAPQNGTSDWTTIYTKVPAEANFSKNITIKGNGPCFYGDDALDVGVPADEKGFNSTSTNNCQLQATYHATPEKFLESTNNQLLLPQQELVLLKYYSYNRISTDYIGITFQGMIEPPRSRFLSSKPYTNILATHQGIGSDKGNISFTWEDSQIDAPALGNIIGYKVIFSGVKKKLDNIFDFNTVDYLTETNYSPTKLYYLDHMDTVNKSIMINDLPELAYYYFRVLPIREYTSDKTYRYVSHNPSGNARLQIMVPDEKMTYDSVNNIMLDKSLQDMPPMFKSAAIDACNDAQITVYKNGSLSQISKQLITQSVLDIIIDDSDRNSPGLSPISSYQVDFSSHWVSDPAQDITPLFPDVTNDFGYTADTTKYYFKCETCNPKTTLSWIYGLVEDIGKPATYVYTDENFLSASARCYFTP